MSLLNSICYFGLSLDASSCMPVPRILLLISIWLCYLLSFGFASNYRVPLSFLIFVKSIFSSLLLMFLPLKLLLSLLYLYDLLSTAKWQLSLQSIHVQLFAFSITSVSSRDWSLNLNVFTLIFLLLSSYVLEYMSTGLISRATRS